MLELFPHQTMCQNIELYKPVYRISEKHFAKTIYFWTELGRSSYETAIKLSLQRLVREAEISKLAYDAGLSVPAPEGIYEVKIKDKDPDSKWTVEKQVTSFVTQFIEGVPMYGVRQKEERQEVERLHQAELKKARKLGFEPADTAERNAIWVSKERKLYLVDLESWKFNKKTSLRDRLKQYCL